MEHNMIHLSSAFLWLVLLTHQKVICFILDLLADFWNSLLRKDVFKTKYYVFQKWIQKVGIQALWKRQIIKNFSHFYTFVF